MKTLLRELYYPGQYFELELFSNYTFVACYPKLAKSPYIFKLPMDNPRALYHNFKLIEFYMLNKFF